MATRLYSESDTPVPRLERYKIADTKIVSNGAV